MNDITTIPEICPTHIDVAIGSSLYNHVQVRCIFEVLKALMQTCSNPDRKISQAAAEHGGGTLPCLHSLPRGVLAATCSRLIRRNCLKRVMG